MRIANSNVELASARFYSSDSRITMQKGQMTIHSLDSKSNGFGALFTNYNSDGGLAIDGPSRTNTRISEIENIRMQLMEKILNMMQMIYGKDSGSRHGKRMQNLMNELSTRMHSGNYQWMSVSTTNYIHTEEEKTAFTARGQAETADGKKLEFGVSLSMSRKFMEEIGVAHMQPAELIDPLVINIGDGITKISDQTFTFDLDSDSTEDKIHSLSEGAGFLAYDRNGDGIIGNGSELFGATSGDGFLELSAYDDDNDGWIDEDDAIYDKLLVWCKSPEGADTLMTLKEADVGAIYLGSAKTQFTSQGSDFLMNAQFRSSGVFLRESTGEVGMVHQIDLAKSG